MDHLPGRAGLGKHGNECVRILDHQVDLDGQGGHLLECADDMGAECEVGDKMAVHHVDVQPVGSGNLRFAHLVGQVSEVRRQKRGSDLHG